MKKYVLFLILLYPAILFAQPLGSGTEADPYHGLVLTPWTLNGNFWCGDLQVTNGTFTILEGSTLKFGEGANLTISGTGVLIADGTSSNPITFTADPTGINSWGHIIIDNFKAATNSLLDHCIINFGDVSSFPISDSRSYGGGIYAKTSKLEITNCLIENNKAQWGGGIFVGVSASPKINNCKIRSNTALEGGGGLYFWQLSSSIVTNCIIENNICIGTNYGGGGIFIGHNSGNVRIVNCSLVHNSSSNVGNGIYFISSDNARIINSILWGSDNQLFFNNTTSSVIQHCGVQGVSYPTCLNLNAENTASDGPNFRASDGSDWAIEFISPCRDAGTTTDPSLLYDYLGNSRISSYDIGAYEVQYSRWLGTTNTTWSVPSNWDANVAPLTGTGDVVIPAGLTNYPTSSTAQDFTIGTNKQLIIEPGARVTLGNLTNNGIINLNHNVSGFASLIINGYTRGSGGSEAIQLYLTGGGGALLNDYKWHYISTPVSSLSTDVFTVNTYNLAQFIESRVSLDLLQGWVAFDGYVYSGGTGPTFNTLTPGKGFNYFNDVDNTYTFGGLFNTSNVTSPLSFNGVAAIHGFNLLGNPFSSGLNWDDIIEGIYFNYPTNTSKGLYFTRNNEQCSYIAGVGVPSDVTGIIPPMQGFFNKTYSTGNSITLPAAARTHNNIPARYKGETIIPLVRLAVFENEVSNDETVVRFNDLAKSDLDNDYDAIKMFLTANKTSIHTSMGGTDYAINGQPFPESTLEIPVVVNVVSAGTHKISATQLQGLYNYSVSLTDKTTGFTANLNNTPDVTFSASAGSISDRFTLKISNVSTGTDDILSSDNSFNIYHNFDNINIQTLFDAWDGKTGSVRVLDMAGKIVTDLRTTEFSKTSVTQVQAPALNGLYFIEIRSGMNRFVGKVVIR